MKVRFGPAGNSELFYEQGYKSTEQAPKWLNEMGLDAYEYSCTRGIKIREDRARKIKAEAKKYDILLSVHSPYFINLSSLEEQKRENSIKYILDTLKIAKAMDAKKIVVHSGSCSKISRDDALELAKNTLQKAINKAKELNYGDIHICPETMGKINQLGSLQEVMELCKLDDNLLPTIDFGHLHTRDLGALNEYKDYLKVFQTIENELGIDRLKKIHIHYSRIEFTKGGEKKHWTYAHTEYGPEFEPIAEIIYKKNLSPTIICESRGTQAKDASKLQEIYFNIKGE